jgi:hypothetical protein
VSGFVKSALRSDRQLLFARAAEDGWRTFQLPVLQAVDNRVQDCYTESNPEAFFLCYFEPTNTLNGNPVMHYGCRAPAGRRKAWKQFHLLGKAKIAAAGTHLAEARSQSAQGGRVILRDGKGCLERCSGQPF